MTVHGQKVLVLSVTRGYVHPYVSVTKDSSSENQDPSSLTS